MERHVVREVPTWWDLKEFNEPIRRDWKDTLIIMLIIVFLASFWILIFFFLFL